MSKQFSQRETEYKSKRHVIALVAAVVIALASLPAACAPNAPAPAGQPEPAGSLTKNVYAMVSKDIHNPYMKKAYDGFEAACKEIGVDSLFLGPDIATPERQIDIIERYANDDTALIAVAANDADALHPALQSAMEKGLKVISFDSAVNKDSRLTHVQQANPEQIGRVLVQAAYVMTGGEGGIAILSTTRQATNQNLWIMWMKKELDENAEKYEKTPLIQIAYGEDEPVKSAAATAELLENPDISVIIAPTAVGMLAAGKYLQNNESNVLLTGLGLPSEMAPFIEGGVCPWMYLWNPVDLGYLTAYTGDALVNGRITGASGDTFFAGNMGERIITTAADGGTEVMLGDPFKFDQANIAVWKEVY